MPSPYLLTKASIGGKIMKVEICSILLINGKVEAMNRLKVFIKSELSGWKKWQIFWMVFATSMILGTSIYQNKR